MNPFLAAHRAEILRLASRNKLTRVRAFGSFARNEPTPESDLDLLVELQQGATGFSLGAFLMDVAELTGKKVDVVTEKSLHPAIREHVLKESVYL